MSSREIRVTGDGSHTIYVPELNESYHSTHGAVQESLHVFIDAGIRYYLQDNAPGELQIFEVGFGTGLNAVLAAIFAEQELTNVYFESIEAYPISGKEVDALNYPQVLRGEHANQLFQNIHESNWEESLAMSDRFSIKKVNISIQDYQANNRFHICFFDAFAPSKQPEMWELDVLKKIHNLLVPGGVFVTYCAKGQLKRDLKKLGFEVQSIPGPPGKKEMVRAIKS